MNAPFSVLFTNRASPELLRRLDAPVFTDEQIAEFDEVSLAIIQSEEDYKKAHAPIAIYRVATEGSQTRDGGVIEKATSSLEFTLESGQQVRAALEGDYVVYTDGSTAQIATGSGEKNSHLALVESLLSNGDEIINTPQDICLFLAREGVPLEEDFLPNRSA